MGAAYSGSSVGGPDGTSQHSLAARHSSMLVGSQEADVSGYRGHTSTAAHYGGQYSSVYGSAALSGAQQVSFFHFFFCNSVVLLVIMPHFIAAQQNLILAILLDAHMMMLRSTINVINTLVSVLRP